MRKTLFLGTLLVTVMAVGCADETPIIGPDGTSLRRLDAPGHGQFARVMTRNLYIGTDIFQVVANPSGLPLPIGAWAAHQEIVASFPADRMAAIADEIVAARPDVVGLQEVARVYVQQPGDVLLPTGALNPAQTQATALQYDYLQLLLDALAARDVDYRVVGVNRNMDVEVPALPVGPGGPEYQNLYDVRLVDSDVLLVRAGVQVERVDGDSYQTVMTYCVGGSGAACTGGMNVEFSRGWTAATLAVHGRTVQVVNTHLEVQRAAPINVAQADELVARFGDADMPVVLLGDLNSAANEGAPADRKTAAYDHLMAGGFADAWLAAGPGSDGLTCCHDPLLRTSSPATWNQRIDFVLTVNALGAPGEVEIVGDRPADRTPSGVYPSDHAGVVAEVRIK